MAVAPPTGAFRVTGERTFVGVTVSVTSSKLAWALVPFIGLAACQAPPAQGGTASAPPRGLAHLLELHDADGDGRISRAEYGRSDASFVRLDRSGDDVVDARDFTFTGRRLLGMRPAEARRARGRALVGWYLQSDGDAGQVTLEELEPALAAYDADGDGQVGRREFEARAEERARFGRAPGLRSAGLLEPETTDPWERLLQGVDRNEDGFLRAGELAAFHGSVAGSGGWRLDPGAEALAREGELAPDFTLPRADGEGSITLSGARHDRPVALIFGSYT